MMAATGDLAAPVATRGITPNVSVIIDYVRTFFFFLPFILIYLSTAIISGIVL